MTNRIMAWAVTGTAIALMLASGAQAQPNTGACADGQDSQLLVTTDAGAMRIRLLADAAPSAVAALIGWSTPVGAVAPFDRQTFNFTHPHVEIRSSLVSETAVATEIDADALGLTTSTIRNAAEAMAAIQDDLMSAYRRALRSGSMSPSLASLQEPWFETYRAHYLIGLPRALLNEALGYRYAGPLASRPVTRGSVMLVPRSPTEATARISIALADLPQRTGKWMVVGQVVAGLDLVDDISALPLVTPAGTKPVGHEPREPVVIETVRHVCLFTNHDDPGETK